MKSETDISFSSSTPSPQAPKIMSSSSVASLLSSPSNFGNFSFDNMMLITSKRKSEQKDSGYNTTPFGTSQYMKGFVPYEAIPTFNNLDYQSEVVDIDLDAEAKQFMENPSNQNTLNVNVEGYEVQLTQAKVLADLKYFIRKGLQNELLKIKESTSDQKMVMPAGSNNNVGLGNSYTDPQLLPEEKIERAFSPDIFHSQDDEDISKNDPPGSVLLTQIDIDEFTQRNTSARSLNLLKKIEGIMRHFLEKIVSGEPLDLMIRSTTNSTNCCLEGDEILTLKPSQDCTLKRISIMDGRSQFRFGMIVFLLSEVYNFLLSGTSCTARELYYKDPEFAQYPANINLGMRDICCLLDAAPWELGVFSTSKGLIAGSLQINLSNGETVDYSIYPGGTLLPQDTSGVESLKSNAKYALIVEKDTVFEKLIKLNIFEILGQDLILITGKGFPDVSTRIIVKKIATDLEIPIYGLFDADPFGIEIFFVYRHGSRAMSFNADHLACSKVQWIGIHPSEIELLGVPSMVLSSEDKRKLRKLLERSYITEEVKRELLILQRGNRKAEIEGISSFSENYLLSEYIPNKIRRNFTK